MAYGIEQDVEQSTPLVIYSNRQLSAAEKVALDHTAGKQAQSMKVWIRAQGDQNKLTDGQKPDNKLCQILYMNCNRNKLYLQRMLK